MIIQTSFVPLGAVPNLAAQEIFPDALWFPSAIRINPDSTTWQAESGCGRACGRGPCPRLFCSTLHSAAKGSFCIQPCFCPAPNPHSMPRVLSPHPQSPHCGLPRLSLLVGQAPAPPATSRSVGGPSARLHSPGLGVLHLPHCTLHTRVLMLLLLRSLFQPLGPGEHCPCDPVPPKPEVLSLQLPRRGLVQKRATRNF